MSPTVVIADSSALIVLDNIGELDVLRQLFSEIVITSEVAHEYGRQIPNWIILRNASQTALLRPEISDLDSGEASSIAFALDADNPLLVIDERKGRRIAEQLNIEIIGTVGILIKARIAGFIESPETLLSRLEAVDFRMSAALKSLLVDADDRIH